MKAQTIRTGTSNRSRTISRLLPILIVFMLLAGFYWLQASPSGPCQEPVAYRIGSVDERFNLSRQDVANAMLQAASLWEKASGRDLFREEPGGEVEINLVYDYRQAAADKLKGMSVSIDNTQGSYDALKAWFEKQEAEFRQREADFASDVDSYNARMNALNAESSASSQKGGASEDVYQRLMAEKDALNRLHDELQQRQVELKEAADNLNSMVVVINEIATNLNLHVMDYNQVGKKLTGEFHEGFYSRKNGRQSITIFHFNDRDKLVRVLAHELGHALGLNHTNNPRSLMYRLNQSEALKLTPEDITALKSRCGNK